jgi:catechol 2,3-dioxygenase-like lactoylglutathione lyase family enzyme
MSDPLERLRMPIVPIEPRPEFAAVLLRRIRGAEVTAARDTATVRYFVDDIDAAVAFYRELLGFEEELRPSPLFAMLYRGDLRLLLSVPGEPHLLPDGTLPRPGGHNRISLRVDDLAATVEALRRGGARFRTDIVAGVAVHTILLQDPAGNPVELFQPRAGYHERGATRQAPPDQDHPSTPSGSTPPGKEPE